MLSSAKTLLSCTLLALTIGCRAQSPDPGKLSPELYRRVEILIRQRTKIPPNYLLNIGTRKPSDIPGYDSLEVTVTADGTVSRPIPFLLSRDGKTLAQFSRYDISKDPKTLVSATGRPARGGGDDAPVDIVVFDDLECPYCAKMHGQIFPALVDRYGTKVHIVYRDFPISQHPWAMRAAVDTNCVGSESAPGYWNLVDYIHAHAAELGGDEKSLKKANDTLDQLTVDQAKFLKLDTAKVEACVKKQDESAMKASLKLGEDLGVDSTPILFINGEKLEGAYPLVDVFRMVDGALLAAGQIPPPPYVEPPPPAVPRVTVSPASGTAPAPALTKPSK